MIRDMDVMMGKVLRVSLEASLWGGGEGAGKRMSSPTPRVGKSLQYLSDRLLSCRERVAGRQ